jgi:hypothetical protein
MVSKSTEEELRSNLKEGRIKLGYNARTDRIYRAVKSIVDYGNIYHVLTDTPEQNSDVFRILVDDQIVVGFELDRDNSEASPEEVQTFSVKEYMKATGGGLAAAELRIAIELAQSELNH